MTFLWLSMVEVYIDFSSHSEFFGIFTEVDFESFALLAILSTILIPIKSPVASTVFSIAPTCFFEKQF